MKALTGASVDLVNFEGYEKVADLIDFDGPLLSLYRNKGENILFYWCDKDDDANRWLVFGVSNRDLEEFLKKSLTLYNLILSPDKGYLYAIDLDSNRSILQSKIVSPKELPEDYKPSEDSYFEEELNYQFTSNRLKVAIDGDWSFEDLRKFPILLENAYAFIYHFLDNISSTFQLPTLPMCDGFSSMHLFNGLRSLLPLEWRTQLNAIQYASPGSIVIKAKAESSKALLKVLNAVRAEESKAATSYKYLYGLLGDKGLRSKDVEQVKLTPEIEKELKKLAVELARDMDIPNPERLIKDTPNALLACKVVLAFYRLTHERILEYERDNRMYFPTLQ